MQLKNTHALTTNLIKVINKKRLYQTHESLKKLMDNMKSAPLAPNLVKLKTQSFWKIHISKRFSQRNVETKTVTFRMLLSSFSVNVRAV